MRLSIGKAAHNICNLRLTAHVMVSSLLLPPPPPTSEGATLGAETNKQTDKTTKYRGYVIFLMLDSYSLQKTYFFSLGKTNCL